MVKEELRRAIGSSVLFFLHNGFRYEGKILDCDDSYLKFLDYKKQIIRLQNLEEIQDLEISRGKNGI